MLVGMCEQAVDMFVKMGDIQGAIDCCVELNQVCACVCIVCVCVCSCVTVLCCMQWDLAMDLSNKHHMEGVESKLTAYATKLLDNNKIISAIQLYP